VRSQSSSNRVGQLIGLIPSGGRRIPSSHEEIHLPRWSDGYSSKSRAIFALGETSQVRQRGGPGSSLEGAKGGQEETLFIELGICPKRSGIPWPPEEERDHKEGVVERGKENQQDPCRGSIKKALSGELGRERG